MRRIQTLATVAITLGLVAACGSKRDDSSARGAGEAKSVPAAPVTCPAGNVVKDGACVVVVTAEKIQAVTAQQSRIDELARLLDQIDTVAAPIEVFDGIRQLDQWQALKAKSVKLEAIDALAGTLNLAVKKLREFKIGLGETSARLANLKGELDRLMAAGGGARRLEDARAVVSTQLRAAVEPLAVQVKDTIQGAIVPLTTQLADLSDLVIAGCTMAKLSGGGDKMKELCGQVRDAFAKAVAYVDQLKARPAQLFTDVTAQLENQLGILVDDETRKLLDAAQTRVNDALRLPAAGTGPGSAGSGSASAGSGSAASAGSAR
jgi:hypothetical protein